MVAVVLSAQCTDKRVNLVTKDLFAKHNTARDFAEIDIEELEKLIKSTGFYKNKAKNIKKASITILEEFGGELPKTIDELTKLAGVGRKSANVILGHIYNIKEGVVVDTHVRRLSNRIGFTESQNPIIIEKDLMKIIEKKDWFVLSNLMIMHGRAVCKARKPLCENCEIKHLCEYWEGKNEY
jgi:endonuclease-3